MCKLHLVKKMLITISQNPILTLHAFMYFMDEMINCENNLQIKQ